MMNEKDEINLINSIKDTVIKSFTAKIVSVGFLCIGAMIIFYFNTTNVLAQTVKDTIQLKSDIKIIKKEVNDLSYIPRYNKQELVYARKEIDELKQTVKDIKRNQIEILELLYDIKKHK